MRIQQLILVTIVPLLAVTIAIWQQFRVRTHDQTLWKGGGFGMFATNDHVDTRFARIYILDGEKEYPAELPEETLKHEEEFCAAPTQAAMDKFAKLLGSLHWRQHGKLSALGSATLSTWYKSLEINPQKIRIEYWKINFSSPSQKLTIAKSFERTYDVNQNVF